MSLYTEEDKGLVSTLVNPLDPDADIPKSSESSDLLMDFQLSEKDLANAQQQLDFLLGWEK